MSSIAIAVAANRVSSSKLDSKRKAGRLAGCRGQAIAETAEHFATDLQNPGDKQWK